MSNIVEGFMIGADPELFVKDASTGKHVAACGLIEGDKKNPVKVAGEMPYGDKILSYSGAKQVDGLALEFNIDPCSTFDEFNNRTMGMIYELNKSIKQVSPNYHLSVVPTAEFDPAYYESLPDEAKILGCDPDFNAWLNGAENPAPDGASGVRSAAGHVHIGWDPTASIPVDHPEHLAVCCDFVKHLDNYLGLFTRAIDPDNRRRSLYGKAGAFRPKSYGVEYRVPSNAWLLTRSRRRMVWDILNRAITDMTKGNFKSNEDVVGIINSDRKDYAGKGGVADKMFSSVTGMTIPASCFID